MSSKWLNIVCAIAVIVVAAVVVCVKKERNQMNGTLGNFPINALDGAEARIIGVLVDARAAVENLVSIENKTYMNFIRPMMDIDAEIEQVTGPVFHLDSVNNSEKTREIIETVLPIMSEYSSDMARHRGVYAGMLAIKKNEYDKLDVAQKRIVDDGIERFELSGIALSADKQARLKEIEARASKLSNDFSNNVIAANKKFKIKIDDEKLLGDMPISSRAAARVDGGWEFTLLAPSYVPFMEYVTDTKLREEMYHAYSTRAPENEKIIPEILALAQESAKILGFDTYADLAIKTRSAPSADAVVKFLDELATAAKPYAEMEFDALKTRAKKDGIDVRAWDSTYYARVLKEEKHHLTETETKPYFEMDNTVNGMFDILSDMFDIKLIERKVPLWHAQAKYYDVKKDEKIIAGFYTDLTSRESKSTGAWMSSFALHHRDANGDIHLPEIYIVANFPAPMVNTPALLSLADVKTLFHEMGHALHGLLSTTDELGVSGTNVDRDVVEFPSQFLEAFWDSPVVLKKIGRHYKTGKRIPDDLIERIVAANNYNMGMFLVRQLEFGMADMEIYRTHGLDAKGVQKIFDDVRKKVAVIKVPSYNKFQNGFTHIFAGGYAAGYYSYLWAEVMSADAYMAFDGDPSNKKLARKYRDIVLAQGGSKKMGEIYREFLGHDPDPTSILKIYGLR